MIYSEKAFSFENRTQTELNPRTKLFFLIIITILSFFSKNIVYISILLVYSIILSLYFNSWKECRSNIRLILPWSFILMIYFSLFYSSLFGLEMILRFCIFIISSSFLMSTSRVSEIIDALEDLGLPHAYALQMSLSFSIIKKLKKEGTTILENLVMKHNSTKLSNFSKIKIYFQLMIPLLYRSLQLSRETGYACMSRTISVKGKKTRYYHSKYNIFDYFILCSLILLSFIWIKINLRVIYAFIGVFSLYMLFSSMVKKKSKETSLYEVCLIASLCSLAAVGRILLVGLVNVEPVTIITLCSGIVLGPWAGFQVGFFSTLVADITALTFGLWTVSTAFSFGIIGFFAGLVSENIKSAREYAILGAITTLFFDLSTNIAHAYIMNISIAAALIAGAVFSLVHIFSNTLLCYLFCNKLIYIMSYGERT